MDFTIKTYSRLIETLYLNGYQFRSFGDFIENSEGRCVILRHDVEAKYMNALIFAEMQKEHRIRGTYYFRFLPKYLDIEIIRKIAMLGHEIGYHYDDLSYCHGDYEAAIRRFAENLGSLNEISPVRTICMEGAPLSRYDNRDLWKKYNYRDFGITGEPYFDVDFNKVFYLTDTGRRWDGKGLWMGKSQACIWLHLSRA